MKVTLVSPPPEITSGTGKYTDNLAESLQDRVDLDRLFFSPERLAPWHLLDCAVTAGRSDADVIHVQFDYVLFGPRGLYAVLFFLVLGLTARVRSTAVVVTVHEVLTPAFVAPPFARLKGLYASLINRAVVWTADHVVFLSDQARARFTADVSPKQDSCLPHGVVRDPPIAMDQATARAEFEYHPEDVVVVAPGYVSRRKGSDIVLALAERCPDYEFLLAGGPPRDRHTDFIERLRERAPANVRITGHLSDDRFHAAFVAADVVVLPYREVTQTGVVNAVNQSGVFNWAVAHRRPVAASDCERFRAVAHQWGFPELFDGDDLGDIAACVREQVTEAGVATAMQDRFEDYLDRNDMGSVAEKHVAIYREVDA